MANDRLEEKLDKILDQISHLNATTAVLAASLKHSSDEVDELKLKVNKNDEALIGHISEEKGKDKVIAVALAVIAAIAVIVPLFVSK